MTDKEQEQLEALKKKEEEAKKEAEKKLQDAQAGFGGEGQANTDEGLLGNVQTIKKFLWQIKDMGVLPMKRQLDKLGLK